MFCTLKDGLLQHSDLQRATMAAACGEAGRLWLTARETLPAGEKM